MSVTRALAQFCAGLEIDRLDAATVERAKLLVLDQLGCILRGGQESAAAPALRAAVADLGWGAGEACVFGAPTTYAPGGAALLNGAFGHALDFDDTHAAGTLHPGAPVIAAAVAAAEMTGASGPDILAGIVAGYEVTCRAALALPAGAHYARGFHPTATCGVFGAAAAAGRILGLSGPQIESALGIALSQSAGSLQFLADGAWTKPFQVGWAAMAGLSAASLARRGYVGPAAALEGRHGFLNAYAPAPTPERAVEGLGTVFELMATGVKPYPSCRYGHAGIDAILALRAEHQLRPDEIESVVYGLSHAGLLLVGAPREIKQNPVNIVGAQFSAPFVLATALVTGKMTWDSYAKLDDPAIRALLPRIDCVHDAAIEAEFPANMSGTVTLRARGRTFSKTVIVPLGEPGNFLGREGIVEKFRQLAEPVLGERGGDLVDATLRLDQLASIAPLTRFAAA